MSRAAPPILFFDGECLLCHRSVRWILRHDTDQRFSFARLGSRTAREIIPADHPLCTEDTVILWDGFSFYGKSEAFFRTLRILKSGWKWLGVFSVLPRPLTDAAYRFVARHRNNWFGRDKDCPLPAPEEARRFLP